MQGAGRVDGRVSADGYLAIVENAAPHFRVFGPHGGRPCALARETASAQRCRYATNGGPFSTHAGACVAGAYISNGTTLGSSGGWAAAYFGVTASGEWAIGALNQTLASSWRVAWAVNGFSWLVKGGVIDAPTSERHAPRTAIGISRTGRLIMLEIDGCEPYSGCQLALGATERATAELLVAHGALHAINLDGGGSSTTVVNGTVINHPTSLDSWLPRAERRVGNIACVV